MLKLLSPVDVDQFLLVRKLHGVCTCFFEVGSVQDNVCLQLSTAVHLCVTWGICNVNQSCRHRTRKGRFSHVAAVDTLIE